MSYNSHLSAKARGRTVLRTFRLPKEIDDLLRKDAETEGFSVNALVSSILTKYVEWDRYAQRFPIGFITISRAVYRRLVEAIDDKELAELAQDLGAHIPKEIIMFWYKQVNVDTFLAYMQLRSRFSLCNQVEHLSDGRSHLVTLHHELGPKCSHFLANYYGGAIRACLNIAPTFQLAENSVTMTFAVPGVSRMEEETLRPRAWARA